MVIDRKFYSGFTTAPFKPFARTDAVSMDMKQSTIEVALYYNDQAVTPVKKVKLNKYRWHLDNRKILGKTPDT